MKARNIFWFSIILIGMLMVILGWVMSQKSRRAKEIGKAEKVIILVQPGAHLKEVARELEDKGVISDAGVLVFLARLSSDEKKIQAGEYEFETGMGYEQVLEALVKGRQMYYKLVVPEGYNIWQIAELLDRSGIWSAEKFLSLVKDKVFIGSLGLELDSLEGYLYPEGYFIKRYETEKDIIKMMVNRFKERWKTEYEERAKELGLTEREVIILASIIEKETGRRDEKPLVSAVLHNRLKKKMPLCMDPTVIYGLMPGFSGNLTKSDLQTFTPYNTYLNSGLPPGPICNPGEDSIRSALYPAEVNYLYFVSKGDGSHYFSSNYSEHLKAVETYQMKGK